MHRFVEIALFATVLAAAALRLVAIETHRGELSGDLDAVHDQVASLLSQQDSPIARTSGSSVDIASLIGAAAAPSDPLNQLRSEGVETITIERFAPEAVVVIRPGLDRQPGVAGVDDNGDGIVDNASELGATGSDDVCLVQSPADQQAEPGLVTLVLQRGAYVPAIFAQGSADPTPARAIVTGTSDQDRWSVMVDLTAQ